MEDRIAEIFNLSRYEARVYLGLLRIGEGTLSDIARTTSIPRTAIYPPLQSLLHKNLVSVVLIKKRKYYSAQNPKSLLFLFEKKKLDLEELLSELSKSIHATSSKLRINFFPGAGGISLAGDIFLKETKTKLWKTFEHPLHTMRVSGAYQIDEYVKKRVARNIHARMVIPAKIKSEWMEEHLRRDKEELRETIIVSPEIYPLEASIGVTPGLTLLIGAKNNPFAVLIRNDELSETISSIHDMVWDRYRVDE